MTAHPDQVFRPLPRARSVAQQTCKMCGQPENGDDDAMAALSRLAWRRMTG